MNRKDRRKKGTDKYNLKRDIEKIDNLTARRMPKEFTVDDRITCHTVERYLGNQGRIEKVFKIRNTGELIIVATLYN